MTVSEDHALVRRARVQARLDRHTRWYCTGSLLLKCAPPSAISLSGCRAHRCGTFDPVNRATPDKQTPLSLDENVHQHAQDSCRRASSVNSQAGPQCRALPVQRKSVYFRIEISLKQSFDRGKLHCPVSPLGLMVQTPAPFARGHIGPPLARRRGIILPTCDASALGQPLMA